MASKKKPAGTKPAGTKPARERKPRKPPIERAARICDLVAKNQGSLARNVISWQGTPNADQKIALSKVGSALKAIGEASKTIADNLVYLQKSGYEPKAPAGPGRKKIAIPGAHVLIKPNRYDPEVHGDDNEFVISEITEKGNAKLTLVDGDNDEIICTVPATWLAKLPEDEEITVKSGAKVEE